MEEARGGGGGGGGGRGGGGGANWDFSFSFTPSSTIGFFSDLLRILGILSISPLEASSDQLLFEEI